MDPNTLDVVTPDPLAEAPGPLERHLDDLYRLALRIVGVEAEAAAAVEDTLRAAAGRVGTHAGEDLDAWLRRRVAGAAYARLGRRRAPGAEIALDDVVPPLDEDARHFAPMEDWSNRIEGGQQALRRAIDELPAEYRTALILHDAEAVPLRDIAEVLGVDPPGARSRVHRARLAVRKRLAEHFASEEDRSCPAR